MKRFGFVLVAVAAAALGFAQSPLFAKDNVGSLTGTPVNLVYENTQGLGSFKVRLNGTQLTGVSAGQQNWKVNGALNALYCLDVDRNISSPSAYTKYLPTGQIAYFANKIGLMTTNTQRAALQLAIWKVVYDFNYANPGAALSLSSGSFKALTSENGSSQDSAIHLAQTYLNDFVANGTSGEYVYFASNNSPRRQDLLGAVPEPGTMVALGLGALALLRRRNKKQA